ncbi:hypothetical protein BDY19DRAFT_896356 [Irpex rosettiformis]|uniref:Uncharacterized protein n=1 Tax=Irpex rosettiformis TaxID=378272 RepID=A0ACB8TUA3_9APHY|nr:hypothetical protein BDY19DRAFT_896356 [Irpex rosettiformis]
MLRIPLLGRPKIPLEEVVAHPAEETSQAQVVVSQPSVDNLAHRAASTPEDAHPPVAAESSLQESDGPVVENPETLLPSEQIPLSTNDAPQNASSWWSYLGWTSASTTDANIQQSPADQSLPSPTGIQVNVESSTVQVPPSMVQTQETQSSEPEPPMTDVSADSMKEPVLEAPSAEEQKSDITNPSDAQQTPSLFSEDTAKSQGSAWYSPWSWYAASPIVPSSSSAFPVSASKPEDHNGSKSQQEIRPMTESEMVKEEALARDNGVDATPRLPPTQLPSNDTDALEPQPTPQATSPPVSTNPIESSIAINKSGWASFFMSKALYVKTITDGQEVKAQSQGEMEVMDLDDEDDISAGKRTGDDTSTVIAPQPKKEKAAADTARGSKAVAIAPRKPSSIPSNTPSASTSPKPREAPTAPLREREPKKSGTPAPPLTNSESIKKETAKIKASGSRSPSPAPSKTSVTSPRASPPNLVLPTWNDVFLSPPRSLVPPSPTPPPTHKGKLSKTLDFVSGVLWSGKEDQHAKGSLKGKGKEREKDNPFVRFGMELPKALDVVGQPFDPNALNEKCRVVVIGVAGWMPGAITRTLAGGLPSSSSKFVDLTCVALEKFEEDHGFKFEKITRIPLEGDGTIERKVAKNHAHLIGNEEWVNDLHAADVIFVAAHSQGTVVAVHLIDKLIKDGHIMTERNAEIIAQAAAQVAPPGVTLPSASTTRTQKICCLALCGIHLGPLRYLKTSSLLQPYFQYFENAAARELFDFQDTESEVSKKYVKALTSVMDHGTKMVCLASLNDQVVPIYSGLFTAASHPRILRALYIDGDAYHSSDFLSNLLVLLIRIMNSGLSDSGLLAHLSEATAGTLSGVGHSSAYEELASYSLAVNYMFLATDGTDARPELVVEPFNAVNEQNDYEIPWSLRDLIADERVAHFFASEFSQLKDAFDQWSPKTTILRDVKRKLQPIQRLSSIKGSSFGSRL